MPSGPVFPAFLKLEYQRDSAAESSFRSAVESMVGGAERRFKEFSAEAQRQLDAALSVKRNDVGSLNLGVDQMRAAAAAQQARAIAAREVASATAIAAKEQGDYSQKARLAIAATEALAIEEERAAAKALSHAAALEQVQAVLNRQKSATDAVVASSRQGTTAYGAVTNSVRAQRVAMVQLGQQMQDMVIQWQMGTSAVTIFAQQVPQAAFALTGMEGKIGAVARLLSGPLGAGLVLAVALLGPLIAKLGEASDAAEKVSLSSLGLRDAQSTLSGVFDTTTGKMQVQTDAALALARAQIILAQATARKNLAEANSKISADAAQTRQWAGVAAGGMYGGSDPGVRATTPVTALVQRQFQAGAINAHQAIDWLKQLRDAGKVTEEQFTSLSAAYANNAVETANLKMLDEGMASLVTGKLAPGLRTTAKAQREHASAMSEAQRHAEDLAKAEEALAEAALRSAYAFDQKMQAMGRDSLAGGIVGGFTPDTRSVFEKIANDNIAEMEQISRALGNDVDTLNRVNDGLRDTVSILSQMGGVGGLFGGLIDGVMSGSFAGLGPIGGIASILMRPSDYGKQADLIADRISEVFGTDGKFAKTMAGILQGASVGSLASVSIFGQQGNNLGASIGGALGQAAGQSLTKGLSGFLGAAGGPLGAVLGGVVGGLFGSLFGSRPRGSGTVTNTGVTSIANNGEIKANIDSMGLGIQQAISKVASSLGGSVGAYSVGLGNYKGKYFQVSTNGSDPYLGQAQYSAKSPYDAYDGTDATAALRAAIGVAIQQGAIVGIRASTQTLLKAGKDIEQQLDKAIKFEGAFTKLRQRLDPVGAAIEEINKQFGELTQIFTEAGASQKEYADLQKLYDLERAAAVKQATEQVTGSLKSLLSDLGVNNSAYSLQTRLQMAKDAYNPLAARVAAGDTTAFSEFADASRTLNDLSRQLYGSQSPYFDALNAITSTATNAIAQQEAIASNDNVVGAINSQTDTLSAQLELLNGNVVALANKLTAQTSVSSAVPDYSTFNFAASF